MTEDEPSNLRRTRCLRLTLPPDLAEVVKARVLVDEVAALVHLSPSRTFDAKVAVSEACANGIEHARSTVRVAAWLLRDRVLFEVTNDGSFCPGSAKRGQGRQRGFGLPLMASLADQMHISRPTDYLTRLSLTFFVAPSPFDDVVDGPDHLVSLLSAKRQMLDVAEAELRAAAETARGAQRWCPDPGALADAVGSVSLAPSLYEAAEALLGWAVQLTGCSAGLLRLAEHTATLDGWIPTVAYFGLTDCFLADEGVIRSDECMCGRVAAGMVDHSLPFFSELGSFVWGRAQTIAEEFAAEALGEVRGRCIREGFESIAIFPISDSEARTIGVLHLADFRRERFASHASTLECACRVCGPLLIRGRADEQASLVRQKMAELNRC